MIITQNFMKTVHYNHDLSLINKSFSVVGHNSFVNQTFIIPLYAKI